MKTSRLKLFILGLGLSISLAKAVQAQTYSPQALGTILGRVEQTAKLGQTPVVFRDKGIATINKTL